MRCALAVVAAGGLFAGCDGGSASPSSTKTGATASPARQEIASDKVDAALAAAQEYVQAREYAKAEAILRTLIERSPQEPRGHEMLGQALLQRGLEAEATGNIEAATNLKKQAYAAYREAVRFDASTAGLQHSAGMVAMAAEEADAALAHFQQAERLDPANPQHPLYAAQVLMQRQRLDEAAVALQRVLAIDAHEPYAHASLAMLALEREQFDVALEEIQHARQAMPDDAGLRAQHAKVHRRRNEPRQALELLIGLDEGDRAQEAVAFEIAAAYDMLGEPAKAAAAWEMCFRASQRSPRAWYAAAHAARVHLKAGDRQAAVEWATLAQRLAPATGGELARDVMAEVRAALAEAQRKSSL